MHAPESATFCSMSLCCTYVQTSPLSAPAPITLSPRIRTGALRPAVFELTSMRMFSQGRTWKTSCPSLSVSLHVVKDAPDASEPALTTLSASECSRSASACSRSSVSVSPPFFPSPHPAKTACASCSSSPHPASMACANTVPIRASHAPRGSTAPLST